VVSGVTNKSKSTNYKRYNLKDYQNLKTSLKNTKLGGLGANIGGEKWELAKKKKIIEQQYAENLKLMNQFQQNQPLPPQPKKEKTARERALEYAAKMNQPAPRSRQRKPSERLDERSSNHMNDDYGGISRHEYQSERHIMERY
jgi:hypothetical protein